MILRWLWRLIVFAIVLVSLAASLAAIAGALGYLWPALDLFNHAQLIWLPLTALGLVAGLTAIRRQPVRGLVISVAATGFLSSVAVTAPEFAAAMAPRPSADPAAPTLRLMSFNIYGNNHRLSTVPEPIAAADPDILMIQEYWHNFRPVLDDPLDVMFPYSVRCQGGERAFIALFSKIPFETAPGHACVDDIARGERQARISARLRDEAGNAFTVMTTHLDWPHPAARQRLQMAELSQAVSKVSGPFILAGDFNSTPFSQALRAFTAQNRFVRENRLLPTWPADFLGTAPFDIPLFLALDHVMTRGGITVTDVRLGASPGGSDHYPLIVDFTVVPER